MGIFTLNDGSIINTLAKKYNIEEKIKTEDTFVQRQMSLTQSPETRRFLMPIWKLRSSFTDALRPIEDSMANSLLSREKMLLATAAIREGRLDDPNLTFMMAETKDCYTGYQKYMARLKQLYNRTKYIFNTISYHKLDILDEYSDAHDNDPIATRHHYNRIVYVLEMSIVIGDAIQDAIRNARGVIDCARENLSTMVQCYQNIFNLQQTEARKTFFPWLRSAKSLGEEMQVQVQIVRQPHTCHISNPAQSNPRNLQAHNDEDGSNNITENDESLQQTSLSSSKKRKRHHHHHHRRRHHHQADEYDSDGNQNNCDNNGRKESRHRHHHHHAEYDCATKIPEITGESYSDEKQKTRKSNSCTNNNHNHNYGESSSSLNSCNNQNPHSTDNDNNGYYHSFCHSASPRARSLQNNITNHAQTARKLYGKPKIMSPREISLIHYKGIINVSTKVVGRSTPNNNNNNNSYIGRVHNSITRVANFRLVQRHPPAPHHSDSHLESLDVRRQKNSVMETKKSPLLSVMTVRTVPTDKITPVSKTSKTPKLEAKLKTKSIMRSKMKKASTPTPTPTPTPNSDNNNMTPENVLLPGQFIKSPDVPEFPPEPNLVVFSSTTESEKTRELEYPPVGNFIFRRDVISTALTGTQINESITKNINSINQIQSHPANYNDNNHNSHNISNTLVHNRNQQSRNKETSASTEDVTLASLVLQRKPSNLLKTTKLRQALASSSIKDDTVTSSFPPSQHISINSPSYFSSSSDNNIMLGIGQHKSGSRTLSSKLQ